MGSNSSECLNGGAEDRISQLPEDIRVHILSYLPTRYSVRTTVLSKAWKNLWTVVPTLDLDYPIPHGALSLLSFLIPPTITKFRPPKIRKFRLHHKYSYHLHEGDIQTIRQWIWAAMRRGVSELDLLFCSSNGEKLELKLPRGVVRCKTLEVLKVSSNVITYPATGPGCFPSLKFADITATNRDNSSLRKLFCNCPELQTLRTSIDSYSENDAEEITIDAPKLRNLVVVSGRNATPYIMQNVSSLVKANIQNIYIRENDEDEYNEDEILSPAILDRATVLLAGVSEVEYLHLLGPKFVTCSLPNFSNLKQLKLNLFGCTYLEYVMELLERSPKLEDLVLDIDFNSWYDDQEYVEGYVPFEPPEIVPNCVVSHLKTVSITQITGHDDQLDMVKYLLRHGEVLRNMTIVTCGLFLYKTRHLTEEKFEKKILKYRKISNTCDVEVMFENNGVTTSICSDCGNDLLCPPLAYNTLVCFTPYFIIWICHV